MKTKWFLPAFKWFQLFGSAFGLNHLYGKTHFPPSILHQAHFFRPIQFDYPFQFISTILFLLIQLHQVLQFIYTSRICLISMHQQFLCNYFRLKQIGAKKSGANFFPLVKLSTFQPSFFHYCFFSSGYEIALAYFFFSFSTILFSLNIVFHSFIPSCFFHQSFSTTGLFFNQCKIYHEKVLTICLH